MLLADTRDVAMDFVAENKHVVLKTNFGDFPQFVLAPYPTGGVVRIAQEKHRVVFIRGFLFEVVVVESIMTVGVDKRGINRLTVKFFRAVVEGVVSGRIDNNAVPSLVNF